MAKKLSIEITKARLECFTINIDEKGDLSLATTIGLYTDADTRISSFSLRSDCWSEERKIDIPTGIMVQVREIIEELELVTTLKCREGQNLLGSGKGK